MNLIDREDLLYHLDKNLSHLRAEKWSCKKLWKMVLQTIWSAPTETINGWIPVERELPKDTDDVWAMCKAEDVILPVVAFYERSTWHESMTTNIIEVIAWKPIEPYTGGNE